MTETQTRPEMAETFLALREINLGWTRRQAGDFVPEYMDSGEISPSALERLVRLRYVERRLVPRAELDEFIESHKKPAEGSEAVDGESSEEETPEPGEDPEEGVKEGPEVVEESIEGLGPTEVAPKKKVVRSRRRGNS